MERASINKIYRTFISLSIFVVFLMMCVFVFSIANTKVLYKANADSSFNLSGSGTVADPYLISSATDLIEVSTKVNDTETPVPTVDVFFRLNANIDMSGQTFEPIGSESNPFGGKFYGGTTGSYYVIKNLDSPKGGLFGRINQYAEINGVGVVNSNVGDNNLYNDIGGVVNINRGIVTNCFFTGTVKGISRVGGVVGENGSESGTTGRISFCYSSGIVRGSGSFVGGVAGKNNNRMYAVYSLSVIDAAFWDQSNELYNGNIGGVIGGRGANENNTIPEYAYFDRSVNNSNMKAIGYGTASADNNVVPDRLDSAPIYAGINSSDFATMSLSALFGSAYIDEWERKYVDTDQAAWYAPALKKCLPNTNGHLENLHFKDSVAIRKYGYNPQSNAVWGSINNPYVIENVNHFNNMATAIRNFGSSIRYYKDKFFYQKNNLDFAGVTPIVVGLRNEEFTLPFSGTYDGGMKSISNFNLQGTPYENQSNIGIFGYIDKDAIIKNLVVNENCTIVGRSRVGGLVGWSREATIENVHVRAKVFATLEKGGGIIGEAEGGIYRSLLSEASFVNVTEQLVGKHRGIFGANRSIAPVNAWYVDNASKSNNVTSTDGQGNIIRINPSYGNIVCQLDGTGQISFTLTGNAGWEGEVRKQDETRISTGNVYSPDKSSTERTFICYARFVKLISVDVVDRTNNAVTGITYSASPSIESKYWVGQSLLILLNLGTTAADGKYLYDARLVNASNETIEGTSPITYEYIGFDKILKMKTNMLEDLSKIVIVLDNITLVAGAFVSPQTYTGEKVYVLNPSTDLSNRPEGFSFTIDEYGIPPINCTSNGKLAIVYAKDGVIRGRLDRVYEITKKQLSVNFNTDDHSVVSTEKEYDGIGGLDDENNPRFQKTTVIQNKVIGIVDNDVNNLAKLEIEAEIYYSTPDVNPNPNIHVQVRFSLKGSAASNYIVPTNVRGAFGRITKRMISVVVDRETLSKEFNNKAPNIPATYFIDYRNKDFPEDLKVTKPMKFNFLRIVDNPDNPGTNVDVGRFTLTTEFSDSSYQNLFELFLRIENPQEGDPTGQVESLIYTIKPKRSLVEYTGFKESDYLDGTGSDLIYNPSRTMQYNAKFKDITNLTHLLTVEFYENQEIMESAPTLAGEYQLKVLEGSLFGLDPSTPKNYYIENPLYNFVITKAEQSPIAINSSNAIEYVESYQLTITGGSGTGIVSYNVNESNQNTGEITIEGDGVQAIKAGLVSIIATKAGDRNYKEVISEPFTLNISKTKISLALGTTSFIFGQPHHISFVFDGGNLSSVLGFIPPTITLTKGNVSRVYLSSTIYDVGDYNLSMEENAISNGYEFEYIATSATLTITPKEINVIADSITIVYGDSDSVLTYEIQGQEGITLNGNLERANGIDVGGYAINIGTLATENPNYNIIFTGAMYNINKARLTIEIQPKEKVYGHIDPAPTYIVRGLASRDTEQSIGLRGQVLRAIGENAYRQGDSAQFAKYSYYIPTGEGAFTHNSSNYEPVVFNEISQLTILPATPVFTDIPIVKVQYGKTLAEAKYGANGVTEMPRLARAGGREYDNNANAWVAIEVEGEYSWANPSYKPNFAESNSVTCQAMFISRNRNYVQVSGFSINVLPIRVGVTVAFVGTRVFTYDGVSHKTISCTFEGLLGSDTLQANITYSGNVKDVGQYTATVSIPQGNYLLVGTTSTTITINKKEVTVKHPNAKVALGKEVDYKFEYEGFVLGENEDVLTTKPIIRYEETIGLKEGITASGAEATNYKFVYLPFDLQVLRVELKSENSESGVILSGVFEDGIISESGQVTSGLEYKKLAGKYEAARRKIDKIKATDIDSVYVIKFSDAQGNNITESGVETMQIKLTEEQMANFNDLSFLAVTQDGNIVLIEEYTLNNDTLTFKVSGYEGIVFMKPGKEPVNYMLYVYIALGSLVLIIIAVVSIKAVIKKREKARVIKFS